ncbi:MAG: hypothetical protein RI911_334 [Candidatus Parcubacteria bacterium]|jgi:hypothetical protein
MLYAYIGSDRKKSEEKAQSLIRSLMQREPNASLVSVSEEQFEGFDIDGLLQTQGLFKSKMIIVLRGVFSLKAELFIDAVESYATSEHIVVLIDGVLNAAHKQLLGRHVQQLVETELTEKSKKTAHNPFGITDALYERDVKRLFVEIEHARVSVELEACVGTLFWGAKVMSVAAVAKNADEAGIKPFVYQKAKRGAQVWGEALPKLLIILAHIPHRARSQGVDGYNLLTDELFALCA